MQTTVGPFLDALRDALEARAGLTGVTIATGQLADTTGGTESIEFGHVDNQIDWYALGRKARKETYMVSGWIFVVSYGGGEAVITQARERALTLYGEVSACLVSDPSMGGIVTVAAIVSFALDQIITGQQSNARGAAIEFTISVEAIMRG
jgi:hypothetical protein